MTEQTHGGLVRERERGREKEKAKERQRDRGDPSDTVTHTKRERLSRFHDLSGRLSIPQLKTTFKAVCCITQDIQIQALTNTFTPVHHITFQVKNVVV